MFGTWRWNVVFGIFGTVLTVAFSIGNNPITVMLLRSMYAFIAFLFLRMEYGQYWHTSFNRQH